MSNLLELMAAPFAACVVLVGIHAYLGMHVIQRRVIFVDLALAQIAALGATFSFLLGMSPHGSGAYFSLGFAVVGAAIFAITRMRHERIPQEAIIGIVYAVALATAVLVADRAPEGAEHIKETLVGTILWVTWPTVVKTAVIYALVGGLHIALRKRFFQISFHPDRAYAEGHWVRFWDFIFYITFAFVITSSVAMAGVLLVFSFLVIPAVIATLFAVRIGARLAVGWAVGIAACLIGLVASYRLDMPSGPTVVSSLGIALVLAGLLHYVVNAERRGHALLKASAGVAIVAGVVAAPVIFFTSGEFLHIAHEHEWERKAAPDPGTGSDGQWQEVVAACHQDPACIAARLESHADWPAVAAAPLASEDAAVREIAVNALGQIDDSRARDLLANAAGGESDPLIRLAEAHALAGKGDPRGFDVALGILEQHAPLLVRDEAHQILVQAAGKDLGYDPGGSREQNSAALARWRDWVERRNDDAR
jgi:zinc/manganese transport system permease protein